MRAASQRRLTPALVLCAAVLGAVLTALLFGTGRGVRWNPSRPVVPLPPAGSGQALPPPQPLDRFALVWQKPLFSPDRRPVVRADAAGNVGDLELTGVIITPTLRMALVHDKNNNRDLQLQQGKATPDGGWTVVEVRPRSAVFDAPGGRVELKLPEGAAFTDKKDDHPPSPGAAEVGRVTPSDGQRRMGLSPNAGKAQRARKTQAELQAERIRQLNAIIQKRRAEQANSSQKGAR